VTVEYYIGGDAYGQEPHIISGSFFISTIAWLHTSLRTKLFRRRCFK
jgi:hypothetical protein